MRIALAGAHSTGKTTLLDYFRKKQHIENSYYITEVARKITKRGFPMGSQATSESYFNFINDQLHEEHRASVYSFVVSDRSMLDTAGYAFANLKYACLQVKEYVAEALEAVRHLERKYFDLYIYFPVEFEIVDDGYRDVDNEYQKLVSATMKGYLDSYNIPYIAVTGSVKERYIQLVSELNKRGLKL